MPKVHLIYVLLELSTSYASAAETLSSFYVSLSLPLSGETYTLTCDRRTQLQNNNNKNIGKDVYNNSGALTVSVKHEKAKVVAALKLKFHKLNVHC